MKSELERFEDKYIPEPNSGCWLWTASCYPNGYGVFNSPRGNYAHRNSWVFYRGGIPNGMQVLHRCDNPICVNPDHLFLGTQADNIRDMDKKGRRARVGPQGERAPSAKLTEDQVRAIRSDERSRNVVAVEYGVRKSAIYKIRRRATWRHVQ